MQRDTRNITVAQEHLRASYEEITLAQGSPERSIVLAAIDRARSHLDLVSRRLEQERAMAGRSDVGQSVEQAYSASRLAWQGVHDMLNSPDTLGPQLDAVRQNLLQAQAALERAGEAAPSEALQS